MPDIDRGINPEDFSWTPPTENVDGTPVNGPLNYRLYRRADDQPHTPDDFFFEVVGTLQPEGHYVAQLTNFPPGASVIAMTAVDADGDESAFSNTMGFALTNGILPSPPTILPG